jgi:hypothetical protein
MRAEAVGLSYGASTKGGQCGNAIKPESLENFTNQLAKIYQLG